VGCESQAFAAVAASQREMSGDKRQDGCTGCGCCDTDNRWRSVVNDPITLHMTPTYPLHPAYVISDYQRQLLASSANNRDGTAAQHATVSVVGLVCRVANSHNIIIIKC